MAGPAGKQIYKAKSGGRIKDTINESGSQGASDGIRYNLANDHDLVDRETTWIYTLDHIDTGGDKLHWSTKCGSHGSTGEGCCLIEQPTDYSGGKPDLRTESPHPSYHSCGSGSGCATTTQTVPAHPFKKVVGAKFASWRISGPGMHIEFWYDFTGGGQGPWVKYVNMDYIGTCCGSNPASDLGATGQIKGPAKAQDTLRLNSGFASCQAGSIVELAGGGVIEDGGTGGGCVGTCPAGQHFDPNCNCVPDACPAGQHFDTSQNKCVDDTPPPPPPPTGECDPGFHKDDAGNCVPNEVPTDFSSPFYVDTTNWLQLASANRLRGEPSSQTITDHNSVNLTADLTLGIMTDTVYSPSKITTYNQATLIQQGYMMDTKDWHNVEFTLYIEGIAFSSTAFIELQLRGGVRTSTSGQTCESTGYIARVYPTGKAVFRKQLDFGSISDINTDPTNNSALTQPMKDKFYTGIKFIVYDETSTSKTMCQLHIDDSTDNLTTVGNHFREVLTFHDDGTNWATQGASTCGGDALNKTRITWGGPLCNLVVSGFTNYDLKKISVREIVPPC